MSMTVSLRSWFPALMMGVFLLFASHEAMADCVAASGAADMGSHTSFDIAATPQISVGSSGFVCTGSLLSLISTNTVTATIMASTNGSGSQPRVHNASSGDHIPYILCKDASCTTTYDLSDQIVWSSTTLAGLLGLFNASGGALPIYFRTVPGYHVAAGTYTDTLQINWQWKLCVIGVLDLICVYDEGTTTTYVAVQIEVTKDCVMTAPNVNFGSAAFVGSFDPVTQSIHIRCSKGASYTVGIDDGESPDGQRRMRNGSNSIRYEIYYPSGSNSRWGKNPGERRGSAEATVNAGTYTGTTDQIFTYRAEILDGQDTPPAGVYTDTLIVDVEF